MGVIQLESLAGCWHARVSSIPEGLHLQIGERWRHQTARQPAQTDALAKARIWPASPQQPTRFETVPFLYGLLYKLTVELQHLRTMRVELIGHFKACMTDIYLHIDARMAYYIRTESSSRSCPV